jgi:hypothetical protein
VIMTRHRGILLRLIGATLLLLGAAARGDGGINLTVTNDGIVDIYVTVYDTSAKPKATVLSHQRINGFTSVPISVSVDAGGHGNISWTAIGVDNSDPQCGHGSSGALSGDANVNVHVDSGCAG